MTLAHRLLMAAGAQTFNPLTDWTSNPRHAVWAGDPLWVPPADAGAVSAWRNGGTARTTGAYIGADGLVLPGTTTTVRMDCATIPDVAAMRPTGDMELVVYVTATDWTPAAVDILALNGLNGATATTNWYLYLNTNGTLTFSRPTGGTGRLYTSSVATGITDGTAKYIRVLFDQDNGAAASSVTFWLSDDGTTWTQLGTAVTNANTGAGNSNTTGITIGNTAQNVAAALAGTIHRVQVWDGLTRAAAAVLDADFSDATEGISAFTESSSNAATVTILNSQDPVQATGAKQPTYRAATVSFNNQPTVQFDGTNNVLAVDIADISQDFWLVLVYSIANTGSRRMVGTGTSSDGYGQSSGNLRYLGFGSNLFGGARTGSPEIAVVEVNGASSNFDINYVEDAAGNAGSNGLSILSLGASTNGAIGTHAVYAAGHLAMCLVFNDTDPRLQSEWDSFAAFVLETYGDL